MAEDKLVKHGIIRRIISWCLKCSWGLAAALIARLWTRNTLTNAKKALKDKVVVITGASSGIGEALAHSFYAQGCCVVLAARRLDELNRVKSDLLKTHSTVPTHPPVVIQMDMSDLNSLPGHVAKIIQICGRIDILINNAGISYRGYAASTSVDVDIKLMLVNYFAVIALTKAVIQHMIDRKSGHLVYISSLQGCLPMPYRSAYSASKHALESFCYSLRSEIEKHDIKVTVVAPSYTNTSLSANALTGTGDKYGRVDEKQKSGYSAERVANDTLNAVATGQHHVFSAPFLHRIAVILIFFPNILHRFLVLYADKKKPEEPSIEDSKQ